MYVPALSPAANRRVDRPGPAAGAAQPAEATGSDDAACSSAPAVPALDASVEAVATAAAMARTPILRRDAPGARPARATK